jgi:hypothetical protein
VAPEEVEGGVEGLVGIEGSWSAAGHFCLLFLE